MARGSSSEPAQYAQLASWQERPSTARPAHSASRAGNAGLPRTVAAVNRLLRGTLRGLVECPWAQGLAALAYSFGTGSLSNRRPASPRTQRRARAASPLSPSRRFAMRPMVTTMPRQHPHPNRSASTNQPTPAPSLRPTAGSSLAVPDSAVAADPTRHGWGQPQMDHLSR